MGASQGAVRKKGRKNRKHGRNKRKPSFMRWKARAAAGKTVKALRAARRA